MPDPKPQKTYAFGELNPVEPSYVQKRLNTKTTDPLRAMREAALDQFTADSLSNSGPMKGIVLAVEPDPPSTNPPPGDWLSSFFGFDDSEAAQAPVLKRYKIRIPEIHSMLPEPSKYQMSPDETGDHVKTISKYPSFVAKDSNISLEHPANPGDLVWVDFGNRENQTDPVYLGMVFPPPSGPGGTQSSTNPHRSPCGALGGGGAGGGTLSADQRNRLSSSGAHFGSPLYLPWREIKARNKQSPGYGVLNYGMSARKDSSHSKHATAGGNKASDGKKMTISGRVAPGSCSTIQNRCARILLAHRIMAENHADRGYKLGGKTIDNTVGGIDCSGVVQAIRAGAEYLCSADGNYYGLPNRSDGKKWCDASMYSAWQYNSGQHKNIMGTQAGIYDGSVQVMPGDEICMAKRSGPTASFAQGRSWRVNGQSYKHGVTHVGIVITDPDGHLRFVESGGVHSGVGSMRFEEWWDRTGKKKNLYIWQCKEMDAAWESVGGRPSEKWTPELAKRLVPEIFDSNLSARAAGTQETSSPSTDDTTSTRSTETKPEEQTTTEPATPTTSEAETKRIEEAKAKLPQLEAELKALEESKGKESQEYKDKKKEYDETKAVAEGRTTNTPASQGSGQTPSNTSPTPAACSPGGSGQVGGGATGTGGPTNASGTPGNPYNSTPPKISDVKDATACPNYSDMYLGSVDKNTSKRIAFDFIAIHDGGQWGTSSDETACKRLVNMFKNKKGSYNYFIGSDGTIFQLISEKLASWASGCYSQKTKTWKGQSRATCSFLKANPRSISITLRNCHKKLGVAYTPEQVKAVNCLLKDISRRRGIPIDDAHVVAHHEIQKLNHYDPVRYPKGSKTSGWNWQGLDGMTYDHTKENYGDHFPHKVTG